MYLGAQQLPNLVPDTGAWTGTTAAGQTSEPNYVKTGCTAMTDRAQAGLAGMEAA